MRTITTITTIAVLLTLRSPSDGTASVLHKRPVTFAGVVPSALIVGRAACQGATWLLTETRQLVRVAAATRTVTVHDAQGLLLDDRPWGLACLTDGSLWTLSSPRTLARLNENGRVVERQTIRLPRVGLFASGDRLLFQQLPTIIEAPVLATSPERQPLDVRTWPGLRGRPAPSREDQLAHNLVNCGIAVGASVPCWFVNDAQIVVSDGVSARFRKFAGLRASGIDQSAPIWDVALVGPERLWLLATAPTSANGARTGGRLVLVNDRGVEESRLMLSPTARLIVWATPTRCLLLTVRGELVEVGTE